MERDEYNGLDLYDFHARWYDPELCQFTTMDPLCENYYDISPFAYCAGDPVNNIDPTGMAVMSADDNEAMLDNLFPDKKKQNMSVLDTPCYVSPVKEDIKRGSV